MCGTEEQVRPQSVVNGAGLVSTLTPAVRAPFMPEMAKSTGNVRRHGPSPDSRSLTGTKPGVTFSGVGFGVQSQHPSLFCRLCVLSQKITNQNNGEGNSNRAVKHPACRRSSAFQDVCSWLARGDALCPVQAAQQDHPSSRCSRPSA